MLINLRFAEYDIRAADQKMQNIKFFYRQRNRPAIHAHMTA